MNKRVLLAFAIGVLATAALFALSFTVESFGFTSLANGLLWQNALLQSLAPLGTWAVRNIPFTRARRSTSSRSLLAFRWASSSTVLWRTQRYPW